MLYNTLIDSFNTFFNVFDYSVYIFTYMLEYSDELHR